jgi:hypothetical protein
MRPVLAMATFYGPRDGDVTWPSVAAFFGAVHSRAKWPERPQLKQVWPEAAPVVDGTGRRITGGGGGRALGADAKVGGEPTAAANADAGAEVEVDRWGRGGTPSGTSEAHYWMEQQPPSSS